MIQWISKFNYQIMMLLLFLLILATGVLCVQQCNFPFVPMPSNCKITQNKQLLYINPCQIGYYFHFDTPSSQQYREIITHYNSKTFGCRFVDILFRSNSVLKNYSYILNISIADCEIKNVYTTKEQSYKLDMNSKGTSLTAQTYVGFLRGLETFTQAFSCSQNKLTDHSKCYLSKLPILIEDQPTYNIRGSLLDTSRRFIPMPMLYQFIDSLMYNKMNVFHWHLADDESFPLILEKHPEYAKFNSYSVAERYTIRQAKNLVRYATTRGVRVIPELDGPAHLRGVVGIPQNADIRCQITILQQIIDQTSNKSYQLIRQIIQELDSIFIDPIIQLGGDEIKEKCSKDPKYGSNSSEDLYQYYRSRIRAIVKEINPSKRIMFWEKSFDSVTKIYQDDQIAQWWDSSLTTLKNSTQSIVMSPYATFYMNRGYGLNNGQMWQQPIGWKQTYKAMNYKFKPKMKQLNVIGGVLCVWTGLFGLHQIFPMTWPRGIAMAETVWNPNVETFGNRLAKRLISQNKRMLKRGIPTEAMTRAKCMANYDQCQPAN